MGSPGLVSATRQPSAAAIEGKQLRGDYVCHNCPCAVNLDPFGRHSRRGSGEGRVIKLEEEIVMILRKDLQYQTRLRNQC